MCCLIVPQRAWIVKRGSALLVAARRLTAIRFIPRLKPWVFADFPYKMSPLLGSLESGVTCVDDVTPVVLRYP